MGIFYCTYCIKTDFKNFTSQLKYNYRKKVISKYTPFSEFFHHDLIQNNELCIKFKKRSKLFMDIINNKEKYIKFIYYYPYNLYINKM